MREIGIEKINNKKPIVPGPANNSERPFCDNDFVWTSESADAKIEEFIKKYDDNPRFADTPAVQIGELPFIFSSKGKTENGEKTARDLFAENIIKRVNEGKQIGRFLGKEIELWAQDIHCLPAELRTGLALTFIRNPGMASPTVLQAIIDSQGIYGSSLIRDLELETKKTTVDPDKILGIIDMLERLGAIQSPGFEIAAEEATRVLDRMKKNNDNFFVTKRLELLLQLPKQDRMRKRAELFMKYSDITRDNAPLALAEKFYHKNNDFSGRCMYSKIDNKYGAIYEPGGSIESFFDLREGKTKGNLRLSDILTEEAPEIYEKMDEKQKRSLENNYKALLNVFFREQIENEIGLNLNRLNLREQVQFVNFISNKTISNVERIKYLLDGLGNAENRTACLKSFLAMEFDYNDGERILQIAEKLNAKQANKIFSKISEINNFAISSLRNLIQENGGEIDINQVRLNLLEKSHQIILNFSGEETNVDKLLKDLEESKAEIALLSSLLKVAKESGVKLTPENTRGMKMETRAIGELKGDEKEEFEKKYGGDIQRLVRVNYEEGIFRDNPEAAAKVKRDINERLEHLENFRVRMLTFQNELVAFMTIRPDENEEGAVWAESFMVEADAQKYSLGSAFAREVMTQESQKYTVKGKVRADNEAIIKSHEKMGFTFDRKHPFEECGVKYAEMKKEKEV